MCMFLSSQRRVSYKPTYTHKLQAAIDFTMKNVELAKEALSDMPPRLEEELDPVTLHNQALVHMAEDPTTGFRKLNYLLAHPPSPPETFGNLLLLQCQHQFYDLAADMLAQSAGSAQTCLPPELYEYLEATILVATSPEEAYRKYDDLTNKHIDQLRKLTKAIQDARLKLDNEAIKQALRDYDEGLERYIPVLMAMARIYWERHNYAMVSVRALVVWSKVSRVNRLSSAIMCLPWPHDQLTYFIYFLAQKRSGREALPSICRVLQRARGLEAQCGARLLHAGMCHSCIFASVSREHA